MQLAPVVGAVQVLAKAVAAAGLTVQEQVGGVWQTTDQDLPRWADRMRRPNLYQSQYEMLYNLMTNYLVGGNGYLLVLSRRDGWPDHMVSVPGGLLSVTLGGREVGVLDERPQAAVRGEQRLAYHVDGNEYKPFTSISTDGDMMHLRMWTDRSAWCSDSRR